MPADHMYAIFNKSLLNAKSIQVDEFDISPETIEKNKQEFLEQELKWEEIKQQEE